MKTRDIGFTLAELLISLAILGEIATFTIPKIISSQQDTSYNAKAKELLSTIGSAYQTAQSAGNVSASTKIGDLTQYLNYVSINTSGTLIDGLNNSGSSACDSSYPCIIFHNGSVLRYAATASFGGTNTTNAMWFHIDPDGVYSGTTNGPGKAVSIFLYYNGRLADEGNIAAGTASSVQGYTANSSKVPTWFSW